MRNKDFYDDEVIWNLRSFGLFSFNIEEAAAFVARILCLDGMLDTALPKREGRNARDNSLLDDLLVDEIVEYQDAIISGVLKGTLKTEHVAHDLNDHLIPEDTYISMDVLASWFEERGVSLYGDHYVEYQNQQLDIHQAAVEAVIIETDRIKNKIICVKGDSDQEKILYLERRVLELEYSESDKGKQDNYIPPYIEFMMEGIVALSVSPNDRANLKSIKRWLDKNWPSGMDGKSKQLIKYMATLMRRPEDKKGGNTPYKNRS